MPLIPFSVHEMKYASNLHAMTENPITEAEMKILTKMEKDNCLVKRQVFLWEGAKDWHDLWDEDAYI